MQKIIIFGLGISGIWFINEIGLENIAVIIDNNKEKWGDNYNGIKIVTLHEFTFIKRPEKIVITSALYRTQMEQQLREAGINTYYFYADFWIHNKLLNKLNARTPKILLINTHSFNNIGDHAITMAEKEFLSKNFCTSTLIDIPSLICRDGMPYLKTLIKPEDLILISGGGYLGSLWLDCGEDNVRNILQNFKNNKIIILPQTIYFSDDEYGRNEKEISAKIYNQHPNLTICLRDLMSYNLAKEIFKPSIKLLYLPDMVLLMKKNAPPKKTSKQIILCFRNDKESIISPVHKAAIINELTSYGSEIINMTMECETFPKIEARDNYVMNKIQKIQSSKLVITDRLHCMLLSAISGTPCIAFDNLSQKVHGVYKWLEKTKYIQMYQENINFTKQLDYISTFHNCKYDNKEISQEFDTLKNEIKL